MKRSLLARWRVVLALLMVGGAVLAAPPEPAAMKPDPASDELVKSQVETAVSMLRAIHQRHLDGKLTLEQAKELGAGLLRELRYGSEGYFWADTTEGVNVVLYGRQDTEGRNRLNDTDPYGNQYIRDFLKLCQTGGGGFAEYWFTKLGEPIPLPKRSYVHAFQPFGWVLGTGYYHPVPLPEAKRQAIAKALEKVPLFAGLTGDERLQVAGAANMWRAKAGDRLIEQGVRQGRMLLIMQASSDVLLQGKHLVTLPAGALVGEVEFLDDLPASATVVLKDDSDLIEINNTAFRELLNREPRMGFAIMTALARIASAKLRDNNQRMLAPPAVK